MLFIRHMTVFIFSGILIKEGKGFSSLCPELDVAPVGESPEEAKAMLLEGLPFIWREPLKMDCHFLASYLPMRICAELSLTP
jgi:hypothetical protein